MEAAVRLLSSTAAVAGGIQRRRIVTRSLSFLNPNPNPKPLISLSLAKCSLKSTQITSEVLKSHNTILSSNESASIQWDSPNLGLASPENPIFSEKDSVLTVVLLGWLGARQKHLRKYAEMYNSKGIRSVRFVVPAKELLGIDLGSRVEAKIKELAKEIEDWCSVKEKDGRERNLMFHTFSNTGWLAYGVILDSLKSREDIKNKIRGCIIDSGPCAEINPQVWAAGFSAALLRKQNNSIPPLPNQNTEDSKPDANFTRNYENGIRPSIAETFLLSILCRFFELTLKLPDINRKLSKYISILMNEQPACPQLYLYSKADKVIPSSYIEEFIEKQKKFGRTVYAHDFVFSPHVDHFRTYPRQYISKVDEFLNVCSGSSVVR
ncbi:hypothetical protein LUZ60_010024 [Juncus effusus]|nr:hypothetical protein LUZ60_010024 [Juncus effusus]